MIALALFPVVTPLLVRASSTIDGATLLAGYHTAYNIVGVMVLLPLIDSFTRLVERILPERGSPLTRCLDPSALATPIVAVEAVRRTIARALVAVCSSIEPTLAAASRGEPIRPRKQHLGQPISGRYAAGRTMYAPDSYARTQCEALLWLQAKSRRRVISFNRRG